MQPQALYRGLGVGPVNVSMKTFSTHMPSPSYHVGLTLNNIIAFKVTAEEERRLVELLQH